MWNWRPKRWRRLWSSSPRRNCSRPCNGGPTLARSGRTGRSGWLLGYESSCRFHSRGIDSTMSSDKWDHLRTRPSPCHPNPCTASCIHLTQPDLQLKWVCRGHCTWRKVRPSLPKGPKTRSLRKVSPEGKMYPLAQIAQSSRRTRH